MNRRIENISSTIEKLNVEIKILLGEKLVRGYESQIEETHFYMHRSYQQLNKKIKFKKVLTGENKKKQGTAKTRIIKHNTAFCNFYINSTTPANYFLINFQEYLSSQQKKSFIHQSKKKKPLSVYQKVKEKRPVKREVVIKELDDERRLLRSYTALVNYDPIEDTIQMVNTEKNEGRLYKYTVDSTNNRIFHKNDKRYTIIDLKEHDDLKYKFTNIIDLAEHCYINDVAFIDEEPDDIKFWEFFSYVALILTKEAMLLLMDYDAVKKGKKLDHLKKVQALRIDASVMLDYAKSLKYDPEVDSSPESAVQKDQKDQWMEKGFDIKKSLNKSKPLKNMVIAFTKRVIRRRRHMTVADISYLIKGPALIVAAQNGIKLSSHDITWTVEKWISSAIENPFQHISFLVFKEDIE